MTADQHPSQTCIMYAACLPDHTVEEQMAAQTGWSTVLLLLCAPLIRPRRQPRNQSRAAARWMEPAECCWLLPALQLL